MSGADSLIALLTDFGSRDPYVAAVKAVIMSRTQARLIDLTHEIEPFDVFEAAVFLEAVVRYLPRSSGEGRVVVVAVVDPGVGTDRNILAVRDDDRFLLAPDNGLLSRVLTERAEIYAVENRGWFLPDESSTFHGRDRFAPVAAALANGCDVGLSGRRVDSSSIIRFAYEPAYYGEDRARGSVIAVDRYGNLVTNLESSKLGPISEWSLNVGDVRVARTSKTYADAVEGEPFLIVGSRGTIEISMSNGSAADLLRIGRHATIDATRNGK